MRPRRNILMCGGSDAYRHSVRTAFSVRTDMNLHQVERSDVEMAAIFHDAVVLIDADESPVKVHQIGMILSSPIQDGYGHMGALINTVRMLYGRRRGPKPKTVISHKGIERGCRLE